MVVLAISMGVDSMEPARFSFEPIFKFTYGSRGVDPGGVDTDPTLEKKPDPYPQPYM